MAASVRVLHECAAESESQHQAMPHQLRREPRSSNVEGAWGAACWVEWQPQTAMDRSRGCLNAAPSQRVLSRWGRV